MARYSMYSGEQIDSRIDDEFDRKALVIRPSRPRNEIQNAGFYPSVAAGNYLFHSPK